jgi:hypothetical protein
MFGKRHRWGLSLNGDTRKLKIDLLHPPNKLPSEMSDEELLRFGMVAKYMCSRGEKLDEEKLKALTLQLDEARKEWKKRFPELPLSSSF